MGSVTTELKSNLVLLDVQSFSVLSLIENLNCLFEGIDADIDGDNGTEYTCKSALNKGFYSNREYVIDRCISEFALGSLDQLAVLVNFIIEGLTNYSEAFGNGILRVESLNGVMALSFTMNI